MSQEKIFSYLSLVSWDLVIKGRNVSIGNLIIGIFEVFYSTLGKISQGTQFDLQSFKEDTHAFNINSNLKFRYSENHFLERLSRCWMHHFFPSC